MFSYPVRNAPYKNASEAMFNDKIIKQFEPLNNDNSVVVLFDGKNEQNLYLYSFTSGNWSEKNVQNPIQSVMVSEKTILSQSGSIIIPCSNDAS